MAYNQTSLWDEAESSVEQRSKQFNNLEAEVQKDYEKLVSLKTDRVALYDADQLLPETDPDRKWKDDLAGLTDPNAKMAATYSPGEDVPVLHIDEAEAAILALKTAVDAAEMDKIRKFA